MEQETAIERFAQYLERRAPGLRTAVSYVSDVRQFAAGCQKPWREINVQDLDQFVDRQRASGLSPATVKRRVAALKVFFDFLAEEMGEWSWPNPVHFRRHAGKQPRRLPRDLGDADMERLWVAIQSPRDRAWLVLMWRGGLRVGEVVTLSLSDLLAPATDHQPARWRVVGKGQKERLVLLTGAAYAVVATWLQVRPASAHQELFLNDRGEPLTVSGIEWLLGRYGAQVGLVLSPHQLRHTFARQLTEAGISRSVAEAMGSATPPQPAYSAQVYLPTQLFTVTETTEISVIFAALAAVCVFLAILLSIIWNPLL